MNRRVFLTCLCCLPARLRADTPPALAEAAPGIFIRRGADEDATAANRDAIANIGFVEGEDALLVTDPGGSLADGAALRAAIAARSPKPVRYVLLSHIHPDHILGAGAFAADRPVFLGHANLPEALAARGPFYRAGIDTLLGPGAAGPPVPPTQTITSTLDIDLGRRRLTLTAHPPAHTRTDVSILDHRTGTLIAADLLFAGRVPALDGSLAGWIAELERLRSAAPGRAIPGHGPVAVDFARASADVLRYLVTLRDETRAAIAAGLDIQAAILRVGRSERPRWLLFDAYHARNVTQAYRELEWE